ncbi:MAG: T9SS type A sorting domain-containing protein [Saprospiraceae bacterium]|nr:T9SS type A sorting domain-containing protein [Saprospiraceae bacterium]
MMRHLLTAFLAFLFTTGLMAQSVPSYFKQVTESQIFLPKNAETVTMPNQYLTYALDLEAMRNHLANAPAEGSAEAKAGNLQLQLPLPDGSFETFKVWDSPVMHADLAARYPMIRTFAGQSLENPDRTVRLGYGLDGFHAFIIKDEGGSLVMPYANNQTQYYLVFNRSELNWNSVDLPPTFIQYVPMEGQTSIDPNASLQQEEVKFRGGGEGGLVVRRDYRFALACTGEYGFSHGGTVPSVLSTLVTATNTLNSVLERDADFRLILIPNNDLLVFTNKESDPYQNSDMGGALLGQNEDVMNLIVGLPSFDIGHVFTGPCTDVGGVVSGSVCTGGKGRGVTCHWGTDVVGTTLTIAAHEMGHQYTGGHTFNNCPGQGGQHHAASAWEPGSGSTILSYQGSCGNQNIPGPANVHYHGGTVEEFWVNTHQGAGTLCGQTIETSNHAPDVSLSYTDGFYIPISTPFELNAQATDADGDPLTYIWEQIDLGPISDLGSPTGDCPLFRVYDPVASPKRYFPRLPIILNNGYENVETLPDYSRNMNFRCTVRDNNVTEGGGGITWKDVKFKATDSAGPFRVQYPNTSSDNLVGGQEVTITWDVANTDNDKVKCKAVNIKLSTDGGLNFNKTLAIATPNDGSETVFVPDITANNARIRIEASNNIFFDVSNQNFAIAPATEASYTISLSPQYQQVCVPSSAAVELLTGSVLGYDQPIEFEIVSGLPTGVHLDFTNNPAMPGESAVVTFDMADVTADGDFEMTLRSISGKDTTYLQLFFNIFYNDFSALEAVNPSNGQSDLGLQPIFTWTDLPQADLYDFELSTSPTFEPSTIIESGTGLTEASFTPGNALEESSIYYWRVRPSNECGTADFMTTKTFQTFTVQCAPFNSSDIPKAIPGVGTPTVLSTLTILQSGTISDVNVTQLKGEHDALNDLRISLVSPAGTSVKLFENICGNVSTFNFGLNDESPFAIDCPPLNGYSYMPQEALSLFDGENTVGTWSLKVEVIDPEGQGGSIEKWGLEFCASISPNSPYLVNDDTIYVKPLDTRIIHNFELAVDDVDNQGDELVFTVIDETDFGYLSRNGVPLSVGDQFNMSDIHLQKISYTNTDGNAIYDFFTFIVEDGTGGWLGTPKMNIIIDENATTGTTEAAFENSISLAPNPASTLLYINFLRPLDGSGKATFFDVQGRLIATQNFLQDTRKLQVSLDEFGNGIYFVNITTPNGVVAKKFVVEK